MSVNREGLAPPGMTNVTDLNPKKPRKIGDTIYTDSGSRLSPTHRVIDSGWFKPLIITLPFAAFFLVFFW